jgi:hypothetical protein
LIRKLRFENKNFMASKTAQIQVRLEPELYLALVRVSAKSAQSIQTTIRNKLDNDPEIITTKQEIRDELSAIRNKRKD